MHAHRAGRKEDPCRRARRLHQRVHHVLRELVVHHGIAGAIDSNAVLRDGAIARQHEDHLQAWKRAHHTAVLLAEPGQVLGRRERKVHARLQHVTFLLGAIDIEALGVTHIVGDGLLVLAHQDVRGVTREALAQQRQASFVARAQQQRARADRAARQDDGAGADAVVARLPFTRHAFVTRQCATHAHDDRALLDAQCLGARDDFHAAALGRGQLHTMRSLFGQVRTAEVAETAAQAALQVERELLDVEARLARAFYEQAVVVVDELRLEQMHIVLLAIFLGTLRDIAPGQARHVPVVNHTLRRDQRCACIHDCRAAVCAPKRQRHRALRGQETAAILIQRFRHVEFSRNSACARGLWPQAPFRF